MAFIPIHAKADVPDTKKGKITPAQSAQLNAWCLSSKTGILDIYNNTTKEYERCEAEEMNYTASDNIATVVFKKGYVVICGRLVECEAGTQVQITTPAPAGSSVSGKIVLRCNLQARGESEFEVITTTEPLVKEDLNNNPITGRYDFELYSYSATPTSVVLHERTQPYIKEVGKTVQKVESMLRNEIATNWSGGQIVKGLYSYIIKYTDDIISGVMSIGDLDVSVVVETGSALLFRIYNGNDKKFNTTDSYVKVNEIRLLIAY